MADGAAQTLKSRVSAGEWQARVELAALYRLVALHGWDDMIFTHISARVPGPEHHFLINPYGYYFEEITASSLVKVDLEGKIVQETQSFINPAGFTIHSAIHAAREEMALTLTDVMTRRTRLAMLAGKESLAAAEVVADLLASELGWDQDHRQREIEEFRHELETEYLGLSPSPTHPS